MKESDLNSKLAYDITMGNFSLNLPTVKKKIFQLSGDGYIADSWQFPSHGY